MGTEANEGGVKNENGAGAGAAEGGGQFEHIEISVKAQDGEIVKFKIKNTTKFGKVFAAYAAKKGIRADAVRFLHDGDRLEENDTPASRGVEDGDLIDALLEQTGGGAQ